MKTAWIAITGSLIGLLAVLNTPLEHAVAADLEQPSLAIETSLGSEGYFHPALEDQSDQPAVAAASYEAVRESLCKLCDCGDCDRGCGAADCCCCPLWTVAVDVLAMQRDQTNITLLRPDEVPVPIMENLDVGLRAGPRVAIARRMGCRHDIEFEFFSIDGWNDALVAPTAVGIPWFGGVITAVPPINVTYGSTLYNTELNWRRIWDNRVTTLVGFRCMELNESMAFNDTVSPGPLLTGDTDNHLYGLQIGIEGVLLDRGRLQIDAGLKAGVYHNNADFSSSIAGVPRPRVSEDHTAFESELILGARYAVTNRFSVRAGYQVMWIEGVALMPGQLNHLPLLQGDLNTGGSPLYHGGYAGLQYEW